MAALIEQETTVTMGKTEANVYIYTSVPAHLRRLRKNCLVVEVAGGDDWGRFTVPADLFDPLKGFRRKRKPLTDEQRQAAAERLAKAREARHD